MKRAKNVDEYIANAPEALQDKLSLLRKTIKSVAPEALERISYGMPYYGLNGRLAYFRYNKEHIGLYVPPPVIEEHQKDLEKYGTSKATVRFPVTENLPIPLIKKLIKARVKINQKSK